MKRDTAAFSKVEEVITSASLAQGIETAQKAIKHMTDLKIVQDAKEAVENSFAAIEAQRGQLNVMAHTLDNTVDFIKKHMEALVNQLGEKEKELARLRPGRKAARTRR